MYPDTHGGLVSSWIAVGPGEILSRFKLGNLESDKIQLSSDTYAPGGYSKSHTHPERHQSYYVVKGRVHVEVADETAELGPGHVVLIPANTTHAFRNTGEENLTLLVISSYI